MEFNQIPTNLVMWSALISFILPFITAVVNQPGWTDEKRGGVFFVLALISSLGNAWFQDLLNFENIVTSFLVVFYLATVQYQLWGKASNILTRVEYATSRKEMSGDMARAGRPGAVSGNRLGF